MLRGNPPLLLALRAAVPFFTALMLLVKSVQAASPAVEKVRVQNHNGFTRVVLETTAPIEPNLFTMGKPERLVIDLPELQWRIPRPSGFIDNPLVNKFSFGLFQPGVSRLVLNLSAPTQVLRRRPSQSGRVFMYEIDLAYKLPVSQPEPVKSAAPALVVDEFPLLDLPKEFPVIDIPESPPIIELPVASTVTPATKSVFEERSFDPLKAQFEALGDALGSTFFEEKDEIDNIIVVEADAKAVAEIELEVIPDLAPETPDLAPERANSVEKTDKTVEIAALSKIETESKKVEKTKIKKAKPEKPKRPPTRVVIDPGHGGRDPGTGSESGIAEKKINLAFAKTLAALLEADENFEVFMTREDDMSVKLRNRVKFARNKDADLFISIHADWSLNPRAKGATAYTLSEEASVEALDKIATKRGKAGKVAGVDLAAEREDVARLLVDMARRETQARSVKFAEFVVSEVAKETPVLRRPLRKDSFHVLKAPDMPSVLLELGFLSNETDRERLKSEVWRLKTAQAVKRAIDKYRFATGARDFATKR